ncbi:hypothetical protein [Oscillatoria sp. FACHB-1406]|uniref:hypothetical protein n=1 Tax=Oscillatoria sp. FACHB-1406 TaxID=2692846 RepID=UPI0016873304|nr:hypothetical protein [Oscillatoria sp. FACHB-1406]MBD2577002.1 hypothetical protein [Oscillatoria sp. FACHB-1406]
MPQLALQQLPCVLLLSVLGLTSACQSLPVPPALLSAAGVSAEPDSALTYRSERLGLSFSYPQELTIEEKGSTIKVWATEDYRAVREGRYAGGTELPPHLAISTYPNPQHLPLRKWLQGSGNEYFGLLKEDVREMLLSNRPTLFFSSDALYSQKNVLFASRQGDRIAAISKAELEARGGDAAKSQTYQRAFEQIIASFSPDS